MKFLVPALIILEATLVFGIEEATYYVNPVVDSNHPDPGALALPDGSGYVVVSTSDLRKDNKSVGAFPIMFSKNLVEWEPKGFVFPAGQVPTWTYYDYWAPEIHYVNGKFHVYYSARNVATGIMNIGLAISTNGPFGPFKELGQPLITSEQGNGAIDVTWFKDPVTMRTYIIWKEDYNLRRIVLREVLEDGFTFAPGSNKITILVAQPGEKNCVEGPWFIYKKPYYYLLFSVHGFGSPDYEVRVARSHTIYGNYSRWEQSVVKLDWRYNYGINTTFVGPGK